MTRIELDRGPSELRTFLVSIVLVSVILGWLGISRLGFDQQVAINTFALGLSVNLLVIPVGLFVARICTNSGIVPTLLRFSCLALIFVPLFIHVGAWDSAFGKLGWLASSYWSDQNFFPGPWAMAIWIHAVAALPQVVAIIWFALQSSAAEHEEHALLDASSSLVFWNITLPRLAPVIGFCAVWVFVTCAREIAVTDIYRIGTLAEQIYLGYSLGQTDLTSNAITAIAMIAIAASLVLFSTYRFTNHANESSDLQGNGAKLGRNSRLQNMGGIVVLILIIVIPALNLVARASRYVEMVDSVPTARFSISNFISVIANVPSQFSSELQWSISIACVSTMISMVVGIGLIWKAFDSRPWQMLLLATVALGCSLPGPLIGSSVLWLRNVLNYSFTDWMFDKTIFGPVLANFIFCWPISCILNWFMLRNTPRDMIEHARSEGANSLTLLFESWSQAICWHYADLR